jgi:hypothetical protein
VYLLEKYRIQEDFQLISDAIGLLRLGTVDLRGVPALDDHPRFPINETTVPAAFVTPPVQNPFADSGYIHIDSAVLLPAPSKPPVPPQLGEREQYRQCVSEECTQLSPELRPEQFPIEYWSLVADSQKPHMIERWGRFSPERLKAILAMVFDQISIYDGTPERLEQREFIRAQVLANLDAYYHPDPDSPPTLPGTEMEITLRDPNCDPVAVKGHRQTIFARASLFMRTRQMRRCGQVEVSKS